MNISYQQNSCLQKQEEFKSQFSQLPLPEVNFTDSIENLENTKNVLYQFLFEDNLTGTLISPQKNKLPFETRPNIYKRSQYLLDQTSVTNAMRALLNEWMILVCSQNHFSRQTYALSSYYIDNYINLKKTIKKQNLQILGFSAICLAAKIEQNKQVKKNIRKNFKKQDLIFYEKEICKTLTFRLHPDTYIYWINMMMSQWDQYSLNEYQQIKFLQLDETNCKYARQLYDYLDLMNLDVNSLKYKVEELVINLFFILTRKNIYYSLDNFQESIKVYKKKYYSEDSFKKFFIEFLEHFGFCKSAIKIQIAYYIYPFLNYEINYGQSPITQQAYLRYVTIQSSNERIIPKLKQLAESGVL